MFDVFLARTHKVRIAASDAAMAERLAEEFVGDVRDISTSADREAKHFEIKAIETVDNSAFDAIELDG
jgi:hypothetical protein